MSIEEYEQKLKDQNGKCAICKQESEHRLNIDHSHETGKIRDLLCRNCNYALGHAKDDINILKEMINYLDKHHVET